MEQYENIRLALRSTGLIFSVTFYKKDGTLRRMKARTGVYGNPQHPDTVRRNGTKKSTVSYITVWDLDKQNYRRVNLRTVREIRMFKEVFIFNFDCVVQGRLF